MLSAWRVIRDIKPGDELLVVYSHAANEAEARAPSSEGWQDAGKYVGMYLRRDVEGKKATARVVAYLPSTASDPYIVDGTPRELWRVQYLDSQLKGDTQDLEEEELECSEPSWTERRPSERRRRSAPAEEGEDNGRRGRGDEGARHGPALRRGDRYCQWLPRRLARRDPRRRRKRRQVRAAQAPAAGRRRAARFRRDVAARQGAAPPNVALRQRASTPRRASKPHSNGQAVIAASVRGGGIGGHGLLSSRRRRPPSGRIDLHVSRLTQPMARVMPRCRDPTAIMTARALAAVTPSIVTTGRRAASRRQSALPKGACDTFDRLEGARLGATTVGSTKQKSPRTRAHE